MAEELPKLLGAALPGIDIASRVGQLTGSLAAGYADALRERSPAEQALAASEAKFRVMFTRATTGYLDR